MKACWLIKSNKKNCSRLYKKEGKKYYTNFDGKKVTDNKKILENYEIFFSDKGAGKNDIALIEG